MSLKNDIKNWLLNENELENTDIYGHDGEKIVNKYLKKCGHIYFTSSGVNGTKKAIARWENGIRQQCANRLVSYLIASNSYRISLHYKIFYKKGIIN